MTTNHDAAEPLPLGLLGAAAMKLDPTLEQLVDDLGAEFERETGLRCLEHGPLFTAWVVGNRPDALNRFAIAMYAVMAVTGSTDLPDTESRSDHVR